MTVTTTKLTRAAGLSAVVGGLLFIAVQINHPLLNAAFTTTTEYAVRETMKILMAVFSLIGITGIYLRQVRQTGVLGLIGYLLFGAGYLAIMSVQIVGVFVFGIALFRANILPRWAAALLVAGTLVTFAMPLLPQINQRLFAIPTSVAVLSLGYSLLREQRTQNTRPMASPVSSQLDPTGVK